MGDQILFPVSINAGIGALLVDNGPASSQVLPSFSAGVQSSTEFLLAAGLNDSPDFVYTKENCSELC